MRFNMPYVGTEHLLLGLVRQEGNGATKTLEELGVELNRVRSALEFIISHSERMMVRENGLTRGARKVIELAIDEAQHLGHTSVGTEHLLLGLVREVEGIAAGVLASLGVNLEKARTAALQVYGHPPPNPGERGAPPE
jgi:ATP-dependent Clp protease ATP-binding subunit ClpC